MVHYFTCSTSYHFLVQRFTSQWFNLHKYMAQPKTKLWLNIVQFLGSCKVPNHSHIFFTFWLHVLLNKPLAQSSMKILTVFHYMHSFTNMTNYKQELLLINFTSDLTLGICKNRIFRHIRDNTDVWYTELAMYIIITKMANRKSFRNLFFIVSRNI